MLRPSLISGAARLVPSRLDEESDPEGVEVLHRGIATRAFKQTFNVADYVKVTGANLEMVCSPSS